MLAIARFIVGRVASTAITLVGVSTVVFLAIHLLPGNIADVLAPRGPAELREAVVSKFGLDQPGYVQFGKWLLAVTQGDLGISLVTQEPVLEAFRLRLPVTLELAGLALIVSVLVGVPLGFWSALTHGNRLVSSIGRLTSSALMGIPDFVIASAFLYLFSTYALGLTVGQWVDFSTDPIGHLKAVVLPALTLSALGIGLFTATARTAVLGILSHDYITAAIARGTSPYGIVRNHVLRNVAIPTLTAGTIFAGYLVGGAIVVETLYSIPGIGRYLLQAVLNRDYPVIQAGVLIIAAAVVILNTSADILYGLIDPRLRKP